MNTYYVDPHTARHPATLPRTVYGGSPLKLTDVVVVDHAGNHPETGRDQHQSGVHVDVDNYCQPVLS